MTKIDLERISRHDAFCDAAFARLQEDKNEAKSDWRESSREYLFERLASNANQAHVANDANSLLDIANYAFFLWDQMNGSERVLEGRETKTKEE